MCDVAPRPKNHWGDERNVRAELDRLIEENDWHSPEDLYKLTKSDIIDSGGRNVLRSIHTFNGNKTEFIKALYPKHDWKFYKFSRSGPLWEVEQNQKLFFNDLCLEYEWVVDGEYNTEKIYQEYNQKSIIEFGGSTLLNYYDSIFEILTALTGEEWDQKKFSTVRQNLWSDMDNIRKWFEEFCTNNGIDNYYNITTKMLQKYPKGHTILHNVFEGSPSNLVMSFAPEPKGGWKLYNFEGAVPKHHWEDFSNHKEFFKDFFRGNFKEIEDLYKVTQELIYGFNGRALLTDYYGNSPSNFVMKMVPNYSWKGYLFSSVPINYWQVPNHRNEWFKDLCKKYELFDQESLYSISVKMIEEFHGVGLMNGYYDFSPAKLVVELSEYTEWEPEKFQHKNITEVQLFRTIKNRFPDTEYQKQFDLRFDSSGIKIGVDIYVPDLKLAIEGQGGQHYDFTPFFHRCETHIHGKGDPECESCREKFKNQKNRDKEKKLKIEKEEYQFMVVPFCDKDPNNYPNWGLDWDSFVEIAKMQDIYLGYS